jgi:large subunit ribosomal protein L30e
MSDFVSELKKLLKENKLVFGSDEVMKGLRTGRFSKIFLASNSSSQLKEDINSYASVNGVDVVTTSLQNTELGNLCKKPFAITVLGLIK